MAITNGLSIVLVISLFGTSERIYEQFQGNSPNINDTSAIRSPLILEQSASLHRTPPIFVLKDHYAHNLKLKDSKESYKNLTSSSKS